jgi:hypothetical protein
MGSVLKGGQDALHVAVSGDVGDIDAAFRGVAGIDAGLEALCHDTLEVTAGILLAADDGVLPSAGGGEGLAIHGVVGTGEDGGLSRLLAVDDLPASPNPAGLVQGAEGALQIAHSAGVRHVDAALGLTTEIQAVVEGVSRGGGHVTATVVDAAQNEEGRAARGVDGAVAGVVFAGQREGLAELQLLGTPDALGLDQVVGVALQVAHVGAEDVGNASASLVLIAGLHASGERIRRKRGDIGGNEIDTAVNLEGTLQVLVVDGAIDIGQMAADGGILIEELARSVDAGILGRSRYRVLEIACLSAKAVGDISTPLV